jgi:hypothetical protein
MIMRKILVVMIVLLRSIFGLGIYEKRKNWKFLHCGRCVAVVF